MNQIGKLKANCLTTKLSHPAQYLFNEELTQMRLLTLDEARQLQTIPDWYKHNSISKTAFEKCLGNGWTIEVIKHIFSHSEMIMKYVK